jgi:hypothetical protein
MCQHARSEVSPIVSRGAPNACDRLSGPTKLLDRFFGTLATRNERVREAAPLVDDDDVWVTIELRVR